MKPASLTLCQPVLSAIPVLGAAEGGALHATGPDCFHEVRISGARGWCDYATTLA